MDCSCCCCCGGSGDGNISCACYALPSTVFSSSPSLLSFLLAPLPFHLYNPLFSFFILKLLELLPLLRLLLRCSALAPSAKRLYQPRSTSGHTDVQTLNTRNRLRYLPHLFLQRESHELEEDNRETENCGSHVLHSIFNYIIQS